MTNLNGLLLMQLKNSTQYIDLEISVLSTREGVPWTDTNLVKRYNVVQRVKKAQKKFKRYKQHTASDTPSDTKFSTLWWPNMNVCFLNNHIQTMY